MEPNSGLGQAISYLLRHWEKLTLFLRVAGLRRLGKITRFCFPKLTQAICPDVGCQVKMSVLGWFFHVIDDQEVAMTFGSFESQPEFSEHGIDRWCGNFITSKQRGLP